MEMHEARILINSLEGACVVGKLEIAHEVDDGDVCTKDADEFFDIGALMSGASLRPSLGDDCWRSACR